MSERCGDDGAPRPRIHLVVRESQSVYPEPRVYASSARADQSLEISLAPYETVVLSIAPEESSAAKYSSQPIPAVCLAECVSNSQCSIRRIVYDMPEQPLGSDFTCLAPTSGQAVEFTTEFDLTDSASPAQKKLLVLLEKSPHLGATGSVNVDGTDLAMASHRSETGFTATGAKAPESWHFLAADIPTGTKHVALRMTTESPDAEVSVWLWSGREPVPFSGTPELLPSPERISLDSVNLVPATSLAGDVEVQRQPAHIARIDGVFLDSMQPNSCVQGWGTLQRNLSVWEKPLNIGGASFRRGIGTHAHSEITYNLDGQYRRFTASAGPDMATYGSMVFVVRVDGVERWRSPRLVRGDKPLELEIDLQDARELTLIVEDGGDNIMGDHADWAEAKLLH